MHIFTIDIYVNVQDTFHVDIMYLVCRGQKDATSSSKFLPKTQNVVLREY